MENTTSDVNCTYIILEHRRVILQWIPAHCGIKGNEHANRLAKQGANMEQDELQIILKPNKLIMENRFRAKKITDANHILDRTGRYTNSSTYGHNRFNSHMPRRMHLVASPLCTCGTEDQTTEHIPTSRTTDMVRRNIITPEATHQKLLTRSYSPGATHQKLLGMKELEMAVGLSV